MSYISDELRRFSDAIDGYAKAKVDIFDDDLGCVSYLNSGDITKGAFTTKWFRNIADRIDAEMAELPRGKDGRPIHVDDTLYDSDGTQWTVVHICYFSPDDGPDVVAQHGNAEINFEPPDYHGMTHERPDSLERIADEIEEADVDGRIDWADRIRELAKEYGNE